MPVFESTVEDVLGLWEEIPAATAVSFGLDEPSPNPEELLYRVNLPADADNLFQKFESNEAALARIDSALTGVPARLDSLVERARSTEQVYQVSFGEIFGNPEDELERELLMQLANVELKASGKSAADLVSFGLGESVNEAWSEAKKRFDALIDQIDRDVLHFARVETAITNQLIARTSINWSGDAQTIWQAESSDDQLRLHQRNLRFVTQTRALRMRLFVTVASGSARVAVLLATPGGAVLALPAVYQYVTRILAQARELQTIQPA